MKFQLLLSEKRSCPPVVLDLKLLMNLPEYATFLTFSFFLLVSDFFQTALLRSQNSTANIQARTVRKQDDGTLADDECVAAIQDVRNDSTPTTWYVNI